MLFSKWFLYKVIKIFDVRQFFRAYLNIAGGNTDAIRVR